MVAAQRGYADVCLELIGSGADLYRRMKVALLFSRDLSAIFEFNCFLPCMTLFGLPLALVRLFSFWGDVMEWETRS